MKKTTFRIAFRITGENLHLPASLAVILICLCILSFGCAGKTDVSGPGDPNAEVFLDELVFEGKTIKAKISASQGLLPSNEFWFDANDDKTLIYGWTDILYRERERGVDHCNHPTASPGCRECRLCSRMCNDLSFLAPLLPTPYSIASLKKSPARGGGQISTLHSFYSLTEGCLNQPPNSFTAVQAEENFTYSLDHADFVSSDSSASRKYIHFATHVVSSPQDLRKQMVRFNDPSDPNTVRFKFTMSRFNGILSENFSSSLRITKVRFLLGTQEPSSFNTVMYLDNPAALVKARPSQVLFLQNYAGGSVNAASSPTNRCYLDPTADDGNFDLTNCRSNPPNSANPGVIISHNITPTYVNGANQDTLTWFVEYKTSDGLPPAEAFAANEFPVIVWTIE